MPKIEQFRYGDNFSYLVFGKKQALAVDGGAAQDIFSFVARQKLELVFIANTHQHFDHTSGNDDLLKASRARLLGFSELTDNKDIFIEGEAIRTYRTPGHTDDSVCFRFGNVIITGDTLFNGTIGNCFSGNLNNFYLSVRRLMALPDETIVYAGHDYVKDSLAFARHLEPENKDIDRFWSNYNAGHVYSTIAEERLINPYFRFNEAPIFNLLKKKKLPIATEEERFLSLMSIE